MRSLTFLFLLISLQPLHAESQFKLGRLFTLPIERERLDIVRETATEKTLQAQEERKSETAEENVISLPEKISLQGYVKRNDGKKSTFWLNHQALQENSVSADLQLKSFSLEDQNLLELNLPNTAQRFLLKPGQIYLPNQNRVEDTNVHGLFKKSSRP